MRRRTQFTLYIVAIGQRVPSPPWNLTVVQLTSSQVQVSWMVPAQPNGIIQEYTVFLSPPIPPLARKTTSDQQSVVIESTYKPGHIYSYWVRARNGAAESNDSRPQTLLFDESSVIGSIQGLVITSKNDHSVVLSWKPLNKVEGYHVYPRANPPLPRLDSFIVSENNVTVSNLSPGMTYAVEICGFSKSFTGPKSSISFTTEGLPLPEISGLDGTVLKEHGTTVILHWDAPKYSIKQHWEYGVYYALNVQELFDKPKLRTQNVNATVSGLEACESYVFAVGLVGPLGSGPLSSHPYSILTEFNPDAPPKNLHATTDPTNETRVLVTWQSSCPEMDTAVNYLVTIEELTHGQSSTVTMLPTRNTSLNYWFITRHGGRYRFSVRTGNAHSNSSRVVEYTAPIILPPGQVQVLPEKNGSYFVYWKETKLPDALQGKKFQYVVMVSPGRSINMSAIKEYRANNPPIILNNMNSDTIYSVAVVLETEEGFRSLLSEVESVEVQADECQPFLQRFQTSKPMTPYLFEAVEKLLRYLMNRCVKPDLMKCTGPKLLSIDTKKSENLILSKNIDIGFATKRLLGETAITVTERQKLEFIHECRSMLTTMIAKLQEKSPLKQKAVRGLSSLDPCVIQHSPQLAQKRFSFLLEELNHANIINDVLAENAKKEYLHFCNLKKSELQEIFRPCDQFSDEVGLDTIYGSFLIGEANYKHLWEVIKICLVLSHGNATVEGGFSVNKSLLVENMHEKTVIAQRHIHDEIQEAGGIKNIHISKKMLDYVRGARKRYHEYLEMKKQEKSEKDKKKAEKRKLDIQVKDLEGERKKLMMATEEKREAIDVELQELKKKQASLY
uniref:Fibronectin type-III domain-containing protein n=1 Tax=Timema monikensis TaxID=170555 RepID=A0A7R9HRN8_9NEOP|nr:unnamed protein product [Timema monikensis]